MDQVCYLRFAAFYASIVYQSALHLSRSLSKLTPGIGENNNAFVLLWLFLVLPMTKLLVNP